MNDNRQQITPTRVRIAAMDLLARREYSRKGLTEKLEKRFEEKALISQVLDRLQEDGLQSDQRFTEAFVRSRLYRGHGLQRIRMDLCQKGVSDSLLTEVVNLLDIDWYSQARDVAQKKFGALPPVDAKEKAKRVRFMKYRGFSFDQIDYALKSEN